MQDEPEKEAKKTTKSRRKEGDESGSGSGSDDDSSESSGESESGSGSDSESSDGEARPATKAPSGTASVIQVSNPNREKKSMKLSDLGKPVGGGDDDMFRKDGQMSRRER